jgi:hypothetical protein
MAKTKAKSTYKRRHFAISERALVVRCIKDGKLRDANLLDTLGRAEQLGSSPRTLIGLYQTAILEKLLKGDFLMRAIRKLHQLQNPTESMQAELPKTVDGRVTNPGAIQAMEWQNPNRCKASNAEGRENLARALSNVRADSVCQPVPQSENSIIQTESPHAETHAEPLAKEAPHAAEDNQEKYEYQGLGRDGFGNLMTLWKKVDPASDSDDVKGS